MCNLYSITTNQRSEEHTSELQSHSHLVCRLLLEKKKKNIKNQFAVDQRLNTPVRVVCVVSRVLLFFAALISIFPSSLLPVLPLLSRAFRPRRRPDPPGLPQAPPPRAALG